MNYFKKIIPIFKSLNILSFCLIICFTLSSHLLAADGEPQGTIPHVALNVTPLDLTRPPTANELMAAGQLGGQLYPTSDISPEKLESVEENIRTRIEQMNLSFGEAIQEWNQHNYKAATNMFKEYIAEYPDSPWAAEAVLHIGCDARYNGRYSEAGESFNWIIENNGSNDYTGAIMLVNKARLRLAVLKMLQNNLEEAMLHFADLKTESLSWRDRTYASHWIQRISKYKAAGVSMLNCGVQALACVLKKDGKELEAREVMEEIPSSPEGHSIQNLKYIAAGYGYTLTGLRISISKLNDIPLPAIVHISGRNEGDSGHYWVLEKSGNDGLTLFDPQSGRRFHQSPDEFSKEWGGIILVFSDEEELPGIRLAESEMGEFHGGCCGVPRPEEDLGDPDEDDKCSQGSPIWKVNPVNINLFVKDIPMWYSSPVGPSVNITLSYNSQSAIAQNEPFGNKWQFNYGSYLVVDTGGNVTIFMPDGRRDVYTPDGSGGYVKPYNGYNELTMIAGNNFELRFPDDTIYVYDKPPRSQQPFLLEIRDAHGQSLVFTYNNKVRLTEITDAMGRITDLNYNHKGLITQVTDPFGRTATFEYDTGDNLARITDMGGYWTNLAYDTDVYLTSMEDDRGIREFYIEPADGISNGSNPYPAPGDTMWEDYRITVTNPLDGKEEYHYNGYSRYGWYISPRDYVDYVDSNNNNYNSSAPKTRYDYTFTSGSRGEVDKITYPEGDTVNYTFDANGNRTSVKDSHNHTTGYTYNNIGNITSITDAKLNATNMAYAANDVDLLEIQNEFGTMTMTYNGTHDVTSVTDRLGNVTALTHNSYGQTQSRTDAAGVLDIVTAYTYDSNNLLQDITRAGNTTDTFTYDAIGRVNTYTDATGLTLTYDYNDLNNITKITYPDAKFITYTYSGCCPHLIDSVTDRAGRTTGYTYDALKRRIETINTGGGVTGNVYDENGNMIKLIDPKSNITTFEYDLDDRLVKKTFTDGKFSIFNYDNAGLLDTHTNARGIVSNYAYDANHNLLTKSYSDGTPGLTYQYDNYNRVTTRQDGMGTYQYGYDANSRLTSIDGPWVDDTLTYQYDALGRKTGLTPQGSQSASYTYDNLNRLANIQVGTNTHTYTYSGHNPLVQDLTRPNGSVTSHQYDALNRLTEISNKDSLSAIINQYAYVYNQQDMRSSETITNGDPITSFQNQITGYDYNSVNQLLSITDPSQTFNHDDDGNMTQGYTPDGYVFTATYDAENRLAAIEYTDGSAVIHKTEYAYSGDGFIAEVKKYEDGNLTDDTRFIRDGLLVIQERDIGNSVQKEYAWGLNMGGGIGGLLNLNQSGLDYAYLYDGKGNVTALIDGSESIVATYTYDTFGVLKAKTGTINQPFMFSTKQYDEALGTSYYGYRFYSPALGRWITRDPIGELGGLNLYGFVGNNPVNLIDPYGLYEGLFPNWGPKWHHKRNQFQHCPPTEPGKGEGGCRDDENWINDRLGSLTHGGNASYRGTGPNKGAQCVYDENGLLVRENEYEGTYDFFPPYFDNGIPNPFNMPYHVIFDMFPSLLFGN